MFPLPACKACFLSLSSEAVQRQADSDLPSSFLNASGADKGRRMLTIVGDWQRFLGVNVPHLGCVFCGMSEGRIVVVVVVRSVVERIEIRRAWWSEIRGGRVVRRLADRCGLVPFSLGLGQPRPPMASGTQ